MRIGVCHQADDLGLMVMTYMVEGQILIRPPHEFPWHVCTHTNIKKCQYGLPNSFRMFCFFINIKRRKPYNVSLLGGFYEHYHFQILYICGVYCVLL